MLSWYDAIVACTGHLDIAAGDGMTVEQESGAEHQALRDRLLEVISGADDARCSPHAAADSALGGEQIVSNAAVLLLRWNRDDEGMIANTVLALLQRPDQHKLVRLHPELVRDRDRETLQARARGRRDRPLRHQRDVRLAEASIAAGELVRVSLSAANRDPVVFPAPDSFDLARGGARRHLAFARGPHVCVGIHLARLEARVALAALLTRLPRLRLDPQHPAAVRGLVFRKPPELRVVWD